MAVGDTWSVPHDVDVKASNGGLVKIKTVQRFKLRSVKSGVATIEVSTRILTPITSAALESQLIQCDTRGTVRFDVAAGRVLSQQMDLDKNVVGFRGDASSVHYVTAFSEELHAGRQPARRASSGDDANRVCHGRLGRAWAAGRMATCSPSTAETAVHTTV